VLAISGSLKESSANSALLRALADIPGFYVPALFTPRHASDGTIAEVVPVDGDAARVGAIEPAQQVQQRALADAARADEAMAKRGPVGALHGLPVAHKDLVDTAGIRTTRGSPFYRDRVPDRDAPIVRRIRAAGAITLGKTNTPEFGSGSQTFNTVFGATRNPYDVSRTCGGSSGGAAVALACGMVPIADGSDTGGSLRNPAAFCNIVGFRPSPGRVPSDSSSWLPLSVSGPMARSVADLALFLSAIAGPDPRSPLSIAEDGARFRAPLAEREVPHAGVYRIAPDGAVSLVADFEYPNGLAFSPDERRLYVANTRWAQYIHLLELDGRGQMVRRRIFADMSSDETDGVPDGMKVDVEGRVYCTGPGGTWVFAPDGRRLGIIRTPEVPANLAFGGPDLRTLFFTARTSVYAMRVKAPGQPHPWYEKRRARA